MTPIAEHRFDFPGGYNTAYLMRSSTGDLFIHTITRFDGSSFLKTEPVQVFEYPTRALRLAAERV